MMIKEFGFFAVASAAGLYFGGVFDPYPRTVDATPERLMAELADLDIREQPGNPGGTAEASGGVPPRFELVRGTDRLEWRVMSGGRVATRMIAIFTPNEAGTQTRIEAFVERGDAPDTQVSPAFRSEGVTLGLFQNALDAEIAEMAAPGWGPHCDELRDRLLLGEGGMPMPMSGMDAIRTLHKARGAMLAAGCNPDKAPGAGDGFEQIDSQMMASPQDGGDWHADDEGWAPDGQ